MCTHPVHCRQHGVFTCTAINELVHHWPASSHLFFASSDATAGTAPPLAEPDLLLLLPAFVTAAAEIGAAAALTLASSFLPMIQNQEPT